MDLGLTVLEIGRAEFPSNMGGAAGGREVCKKRDVGRMAECLALI